MQKNEIIHSIRETARRVMPSGVVSFYSVLRLVGMHIMSPIGIFLFYWTNLAYIMKILTV